MASTGLLLGAAVTHEQILRNKEVNSLFPALVEACRPFAGPPIRNRGTIGGNIVNASPAADLVPALIAYDASIKLVSAAGERQLELQDFFTAPGQTTMAQDEILTEICLPAMPNRSAARFIKLGHRKSMAISIVNTAVRVGLNSEGTISQCRIVLGAVAPTPVRAILAEDLLCGEELNADTIANAAGQACREVSPISDVRSTGDYRRQMTTVVVRRALTAVMEDLLNE